MSYLGAGDIALGGSGGGLVAFRFEREGGPATGPAMTADCARYHLAAATPVSFPLAKSGGFSADDPDAAFLRSFFADPGIHLTPGDWTIWAIADFLEGVGCTGAHHELRTFVTIHVIG